MQKPNRFKCAWILANKNILEIFHYFKNSFYSVYLEMCNFCFFFNNGQEKKNQPHSNS